VWPERGRQLQRSRTRHIGSVIVRDSLRTELSKQRAVRADLAERHDQLSRDIHVLNVMISRAEEQMIETRKRYEDEIQRRNERYIYRLGTAASPLHPCD